MIEALINGGLNARLFQYDQRALLHLLESLENELHGEHLTNVELKS